MGSRSPIAIDLFSGAGGLSEGLLAAGIDVALAVEAHPNPALTHAFNHPDTTVICGDIRLIPNSQLETQLRERTGDARVDIVVGGPPCQGFSSAGRRDRNDPRNTLFREFLRVVKHFRPRMFLFENVPGLMQLDGGAVAHEVLEGFWELGYSMHGVDGDSDHYPETLPMLNAADFGVPQHRKRLILAGWIEGDLSVPLKWPRVTHSLPPEKSGCTPRRRGSQVSISQAIDDLAFLAPGMESHFYVGPPTSNFQLTRRRGAKSLFNHLATKHHQRTVSMFRKIPHGGTIRSLPKHLRSGKQRIRRFDRHDVSWAVLALPDDYVHYRRHRIPTVREMARLQSFDDDFVFLGKRTTSELQRRVDVPQYTQVGNAVPPLLALALGRTLVRSLGGGVRDLRNKAVRRRRHRWLVGSSGYRGYELDPAAQGDICVRDPKGQIMPLPLATANGGLHAAARPAAWMNRKARARGR